MNIQIDKIIDECVDFAKSNNYYSYDLFDALTCTWIGKLTSQSTFLKRVAIQLGARSPIDFHWLGMKKLQHTKTLSDLLWLYALMFRNGEVSKEELLSMKSLVLEKKTQDRFVWGLNFPYATRFIDADERMPNLYNTCTTGIALCYSCECVGDEQNLLEKLYADLCKTFEYVQEGNEGFFIYYPGQKHPTYNVNALALYLFSLINKVSGKAIVPSERIDEMLALLLSNQLPNGAWYYSKSVKGEWIDGFHTGFIIESLIQCYLCRKSDKLKLAIDCSIEFYVEKMFDIDGFPKYFDSSGKYPIEAQNCAQAIQTLSLVFQYNNDSKVKELLEKVVQISVDYLYSGKGFFYYKKEKLFTKKSSFYRWATSPILVALEYYKQSVQAKGKAS